ncbi:MAG: DUF3343 domain-containing protein [Actinomycetota bacterium]|nr:DUF3343 domain-containing protein [Actinomycetota bacterium]MDI7252921.1 DUF3343 domain-containing protein [Actinomycetota bacterium]
MAAKGETVLVFPSTHHMLRAEALLKEVGFRLRLVPAPPQAGELCTTAIAIPAEKVDEAASLLEGRGVLLKAVLYPAETAYPATGHFPAESYAELAAVPGLGRVMERLAAGETLERGDILSLLALEGEEERLCRTAEALTAALGGREMVPAVVLDLSGQGREARGPVEWEGWVGSQEVERLRELAAEMASLGLVYLVLSLGKREELPWSAEEFHEALGEGPVTVVHAHRLPRRSGALVRGYGVRQVLLEREGLFRMGPVELADEILFLRDNRPGPVGSGNLLPLLTRRTDLGEEEESELRRVLAVLRLVLGEAFLPLPEVLWRRGRLCGGNFLILIFYS